MADGEPLDKQARLRRRRRERLLALLPRLYATRPDSALGTLVDVLAGRLAELDEATDRVLRDKWVALAGGEPRWDSGPHPLERLGAVLELPREPWEDVEPYRRRLRQSAPVLTQGTTTVRAMLTLAAAALDTELCPRLARLPSGKESAADTTLGLGMRPGTVAGCPGCATPGETCVYAPQEGLADLTTHTGTSPIQARLLLTDNPVTARSLVLAGLGHDDTFQVDNPSLAADRPVVMLRALEPLHFPMLRNTRSNGATLFAGELKEGEVLTLRPRRDAADTAPFEGYAPEGPALQRLTQPTGRAFVSRLDGQLEDVSDRIFYLHGGARFDVDRFAGNESPESTGARFALLDESVLTPLIEPGLGTWVYRGYAKRDIRALADAELVRRLEPEAPEQTTAGRVELTLEWWTRPPASFRLRIPMMPARGQEESGAVKELVRRTVERARAAGIRVAVDFPAPPRKEEHPLEELGWEARLGIQQREEARARDSLAVRVDARHEEKQPLAEERFSMQGIFDVTRLDWSHLAPDTGEE